MSIPPESHRLEVAEQYPAAIEVLERALHEDPLDAETVIRLGFNLWYVVAEEFRLCNPPLGISLPVRDYSERFVGLFRQYKDQLQSNADFCWAFGLGMSLFWYFLPGATEEMGNELLARRELDPFWDRFSDGKVSEREKVEKFGNRGIFASYYAI